jgi:hypothetical protein
VQTIAASETMQDGPRTGDSTCSGLTSLLLTASTMVVLQRFECSCKSLGEPTYSDLDEYECSVHYTRVEGI